jgi:PAS domain S-box-containing protein
LLGYTEKELRTIDFVSLIHLEDREANLVQVRRLQVGETPSFEIENRYIHKNGEPVWVRKFVSVLHGEEGEPTNLIALVTNVTERKRAGRSYQGKRTTLPAGGRQRTGHDCSFACVFQSPGQHCPANTIAGVLTSLGLLDPPNGSGG